MIRTAIFSIYFLILSIPQVYAIDIQDIEIDVVSSCLIGPDGQGYQWYRNGQKISGATSRSLPVRERGHYAVEVRSLKGIQKAAVTIGFNEAGGIIKIYIIGDSTVMSYKAGDYPQTGWGQLLGHYFNAAGVAIFNHAIGGRSSRTFFTEGRWTTVKNLLQAGDYVFIQFGHNDRDTKPERHTSVEDYKSYLTTFCRDAKAKGAIPVLVSPMVMNAWSGNTMRNVFTENGNNYRGAMEDVAKLQDVAFIDLNMKSWNLYKTYTATYNSKFLYKGLAAGEYPNYPSGVSDNTHFQEMGSLSHCTMISEGIRALEKRQDMAGLISQLKPLYTVSTVVNPAGADDMTTKTGNYPEGVTLTLKTLPKAGKNFLKWVNGNGITLSSSSLTTFNSGNSIVGYTALYQGGSPVTGIETTEGRPRTFIYPNPSADVFHLSAEGFFSYVVTDLTGKSIESGTAIKETQIGSALPCGSYCVQIRSLTVTENRQLIKR